MSVHQTTIDDLMDEIAKLRAEEDALRVRFEADLANLATSRQAVELTLRRFMARTIDNPSANDGANEDTDEGANEHIDEVPLVREVTVIPWLTEASRHDEPKPEQPALPSFTTTKWARNLHGLTQPQALVRIAELSGGNIRVADAKDILLLTRIATARPENLRSHLHRLLTSSERFEKIGRGEFRLRQRVQQGI